MPNSLNVNYYNMYPEDLSPGKRILIEWPDEIPGIEFGEPMQVEYERTVVASDFFGPELPEGRIVVQHNCWFKPVITKVKCHLALARVAGYREAVYGLPEKCFPLLFEHPDNPEILISSIKLSSYIEGRFCPRRDWQIIIGRLQAWLKGQPGIEPVDWEMMVKPTYDKDTLLPADKIETAFERCVKWFKDNIFFQHMYGVGVFEGYGSQIGPDGRQSLCPRPRGDCTGEAAIVPALNWAIKQDYPSRACGIQILENLFKNPELIDNCPDSPTYGGVNFYANVHCYYGDDNCRAFMGAILASELTRNFDYGEDIIRGMLMILRSCGKHGFRRGRLDNPESFNAGRGWQYYRDEAYIQYAPHRQAYMWAGFLQMYALTGHQEFYDKAVSGISMTMTVFPELEWTNGITQEYARMILPLAFLVEVNDIPQHRQWLKTASEKLLESMTECGAIRELMGKPECGQYPSPAGNADYGSTEASLIQNNGDPACDLLYTLNYAFLGLYEAAFATGEEYYNSAVRKITDFLCRIQVRSEAHPYLDGCWLRGFDYDLWEFFGSSADKGWGVWGVESGWTNSWIAGTLGLMKLRRGLLCRDSAWEFRNKFQHILQEMMTPTTKMQLNNFNTKVHAPGAE